MLLFRMWVSISYQFKLAFLIESYSVDQKNLKYCKFIINLCWKKYLPNEQLISFRFLNQQVHRETETWGTDW